MNAAIERADGTVLVADGEVLVRIAIADYLRDCGYRVIETASSDEAMTVLGTADIAVDAMLCDAELSGSVSGFTLARWTRQNHPAVNVILVGSPTAAADAAGDLCDDGPTLARPYDPQLVSDRIRRFIAERNRGGDLSSTSCAAAPLS